MHYTLSKTGIIFATSLALCSNAMSCNLVNMEEGAHNNHAVPHGIAPIAHDVIDIYPYMDQAVKDWKLEADHGNAAAQNDLALMYAVGWVAEDGTKILPDREKALKYWKLAAAQGDAAAHNNLAVMYKASWIAKDGTEILPDIDQALKHWKLAAAQGDAAAQYNLALMYKKSWTTEGGTTILPQQDLALFFGLSALKNVKLPPNNAASLKEILGDLMVIESIKSSSESSRALFKPLNTEVLDKIQGALFYYQGIFNPAFNMEDKVPDSFCKETLKDINALLLNLNAVAEALQKDDFLISCLPRALEFFPKNHKSPVIGYYKIEGDSYLVVGEKNIQKARILNELLKVDISSLSKIISEKVEIIKEKDSSKKTNILELENLSKAESIELTPLLEAIEDFRLNVLEEIKKGANTRNSRFLKGHGLGVRSEWRRL